MSTREASLDWVKRSLAEELRDDPHIPARAENMVAIAEQHEVPIELLIKWIHTPALGKHWTAAEWRRWCEHYAAARQQPEVQP